MRSLAVVVTLMLVAAGPAPSAQEGADAHLRATFERIEPPAPGVSVTLRDGPGPAPELDVRNSGRTPLVVLGIDGEDFVRLGPDGAAGNVRSRTFFLSQDPSGTSPVPPSVRRGGKPEWVKVAAEPRWRWWERRARWRSPLPAGVAGSVVPVTLGSWNVPARHGTTFVRLTGSMLWKPILGSFVPRLSDDPRAGLTVSVLAGGIPAVVVTNRTGTLLEISGRDGKPFARVGPRGAEVNLDDATTRDNPRFGAFGAQGWKHVQDTPVLSWLERRARYEGPEPVAPAALRRSTYLRWSIPAKLGSQPLTLRGITEWVPVARSRPNQTPPSRSFPVLAIGLLTAAVIAGVALGLRARRRG